MNTAWPGNELEEVLMASLGADAAGGRLVEVLGRSEVWVPLPQGGGPDSLDLDLPTMEIEGVPYVPVFSSEQQFLQCVGPHMAFTVAPARDFARGLPPQLGIAVNPGGVVGMPLPPPAVAELCRVGRTPLDGPASGGRVRLFEPDWQEDPVEFLSAAGAEFEASGVVLSARRALASVEGEPPRSSSASSSPPGKPPTATPPWTRSAGRWGGWRWAGPSISSCWTWPRTRSVTGCWRRCGRSISAVRSCPRIVRDGTGSRGYEPTTTGRTGKETGHARAVTAGAPVVKSVPGSPSKLV